MKKKLLLPLGTLLLLTQPLTVFALTEEEVVAVGKVTATGNVFIWFLCAIAFLKISQKIDSFMSSLGINVGQTGSSMLSELMVAAKGISSFKNLAGSTSFHNTSSLNSRAVNHAAMSGGLGGIISRQFMQNTMSTMTGQNNNFINRKTERSTPPCVKSSV